MKKFFISLIALCLVLNSSSCGINKNSKIIPEEQNVQNSDDVSNKDTIPAKDTNKDEPVEPENDSKITTEPDNNEKQGKNTAVPSNLSNQKISAWMPGTNKEHKVPVLNSKYKLLLDKYGGYFTGDTSQKVIYLTFDEGYENGYSSKILDILKANNVKAAFFVTKPYIKSNQQLVKRMVNEGHIVGNHSNTHPSMPDISDDKVKSELKTTEDYFKEVTGVDMPKFFRPPMGEWSERTLYLTNSLGYKTILWSMAHKDWEVNNQPGMEASYKFVDTYYHNGAILLLHAVSKSNTDALDSIIKNMKSKGYRFAELSELK